MLTPLSAPVKVSVDLTRQCNLRCLHCRNRTSVDHSRQLDFRTLAAVIDDVAAMGVFRLAFSGGEPLLRSDLPEIIEYAVGRNIPRVFVSTNGTLLDQQWLTRLHAVRNRLTLKMSLDGPAPTHDLVRGTPGAWTAVVEAVQRAAASGFEVQVTTTLMKANIDFLEQTLELVDRLPCSRHYVVEAAPQGAADATTVLSPEQRREAANILAAHPTPKVVAKIAFSRGYREFECCAGIRECGILSDGRIVGCRLLPEIHEGYVQDGPLSKRWRSSEGFAYYRRQLGLRLADPCKGCIDLSTCRGGCRAFAAWKSARDEGPDLRCPRAGRAANAPAGGDNRAPAEKKPCSVPS